VLHFVSELKDGAQQLTAMAERGYPEFFEVLIGQAPRIAKSISFLAKRWAYSGMPSFSSQSAAPQGTATKNCLRSITPSPKGGMPSAILKRYHASVGSL
jgi:hypothetical protein